MNDAKLMTVIRTDLELRGNGTEASPFRRITQYWSTEGELLAEVDPSVIIKPHKKSVSKKPQGEYK